MRDITIRDYIGRAKELTAEEVRKLPAGTPVMLHSFDRYGAHGELKMTVVQSGRKKILAAHDYYGNRIEKQIRKETDRFCYTEASDE